MFNNKNKLSLAVSSALMSSTLYFSPYAFAQNDSAVSNQKEVEVIQVRGIRGSVVKSLNTKRYADAIVDAVTAEDIGKFPDQNVAESLQRITGVSLTRNFGEGERVSIRGTSESQNRTLLNGQAVGSTDWWTNSAASRGFNYTMLPSEIVSGLEVYKSPEADIDEGSIGGTIIVRTRKPLDLEANKIAGSLLAQHSEISGETDPQASIMYNFKNDDETFGALVSLIRQERNLRRDGIEAWSWTDRNITMADGTVHEDVYSPGGGGSAMFSQERVRTGITLALQYRPSDATDISFNLLDSTLDADNENQNFLWLPERGNSQYTDITIIDHNKVGKMVVGGTMGLSPDGTNILNETKVRNSKLKTKAYDLKVEHEGELWQSTYQLGYTEGSGGSQADRSVGWVGNYVHSFDTSQTEDVRASYGADPKDGTKWNLGFLRYDNNDAKDDESYFQADFKRPIDVAVFSEIKMGLKYRDHSRFNTKNTTDARTDLNWSLADYSLVMPSDYLSGLGSSGTLRAYAITDSDKVRQDGDALDWNYRVLKASTFDIKEKILAGYVKTTIDADGMRGNLGVRLVHTKQESSAFAGATGLETWTTQDKDYFDVLPSINLAIDLSDDLLMRFSAARVMSRPDYASMTASTSYNVETQTGTGGNPDIDPFRATQFDTGIEWYFNEAGLFSAVFFYKDIQSFLDSTPALEIHENTPIRISRPSNGRAGRIQGLEFGYQQELLEGFGISANYTYVDGEAKDKDGNDVTIPGNSEHTVNLSAYYENDTLSGRISYNHRSGYDSGNDWPGYIDAYGQIDANLTYNINENLAVVLEAINLTDEHTFSYQEEGVEQALTGVYADGRRFVAGIRFNF
ncbi:TonB-dependent receptor [Pseudoalteromonas luteoviolacea]|uniref:TonB-denpendent receptor n=1 Tax=Pseudoalteromonas luteoviolacea S4054 TaxID=1129367 RepID=A0A0F6AFM8_9GAMM|nr:TonB-dependent receptor [Pseudoalteromonas luteoviolacea]AOT10349.1 TonB-dependent receptor [Pseudoalteromonas luteoviolacea]AOT15582.1 TonB-dependent receptor [Pseudoalteromonas luteoviolacea]AOT20167.1 TonB-dependent receptor [Pseudoalteromonas luteoviolacea]KKE84611.1 TonB-denpendent receptor [Pseudoalteromonas luteoviolacea S4054]KZN71244.1 TonB-denpendent receptor [Pseudoalteromonas luteoviolacea S4047-1]